MLCCVLLCVFKLLTPLKNLVLIPVFKTSKLFIYMTDVYVQYKFVYFKFRYYIISLGLWQIQGSAVYCLFKHKEQEWEFLDRGISSEAKWKDNFIGVFSIPIKVFVQHLKKTTFFPFFFHISGCDIMWKKNLVANLVGLWDHEWNRRKLSGRKIGKCSHKKTRTRMSSYSFSQVSKRWRTDMQQLLP